MTKVTTLNALPSLGEIVRFQDETGRITEGEVAQLKKEGEELWAVIREARKDGRIQVHEVLLIIKEAADVASLSVWQKIGRFFRRMFGRR